jgi:hypothetical protein
MCYTGENYAVKCSTEYNVVTVFPYTDDDVEQINGYPILHSHNENNTVYHTNYYVGGTVYNKASALTHGSGTSWVFSLDDTMLADSVTPLILKLAKIAVAPNKLVTVSIWAKCSAFGNVTGKLIVKGGQIAGVTNDVTSSTLASNTETQISLTFTPTELGVVEIEFHGWSVLDSAATIEIDTLSVIQDA